MQPCVAETDQRMVCTAPRLSDEDFNQTSRPLRIGLLMDGVASLLELTTASLNLFPNPSFDSFGEETVFSAGETIPLTIQGSGFIFNTSEVRVRIEPCNSADVAICQCQVVAVSPDDVSKFLDKVRLCFLTDTTFSGLSFEGYKF